VHDKIKQTKQPLTGTGTFTLYETQAYIFIIKKALFTYLGSLFADYIVCSWFVPTVCVLVLAN